MTICLITPPSAFLLDERVFMTLGILRVATVLEDAGHMVELVDLSGVENFEQAIEVHARRSRARVFGITATTPQLPAATKLAHAIRRVRSDARLVLGGPHVTLVHAAARREQRLGLPGRGLRALEHLHALFDVLVAGDGEQAVLLAIGDTPPPLIDGDEPSSGLFLAGDRLAALPRPARHLVDVDSYRYEVDGVRALSVIAQLGCPFGCGFCGGRESPAFRRVRIRPTADVIAELRHLHETYGTCGFMFYDDELNVNRKMVELMDAIARLQDELAVEFRLRGFVKSELFTAAQADALYRAGFRWILTGFESGSPRILRNINKKATRDDNTRAVDIAHGRGLKVKALMSVGHPGESADTIRDTHDWLLEVRPDEFDVTVITTYPGTPYYDYAVPHASESGTWVYTVNDDRLYSLEVDYTTTADYYKGDPDGGYQAFVYTDYLSRDELVTLRDHVERDTRTRLGLPFLRPAAMLRYEHSMGQGMLPPSMLRSSKPRPAAPGHTGAESTTVDDSLLGVT